VLGTALGGYVGEVGSVVIRGNGVGGLEGLEARSRTGFRAACG
jgi:hypothetical protein